MNSLTPIERLEALERIRAKLIEHYRSLTVLWDRPTMDEQRVEEELTAIAIAMDQATKEDRR
jgi:hypothetical protein